MGCAASARLKPTTPFCRRPREIPTTAISSLRSARRVPTPTTCSPIQSRVPYANFIPQLATYLNDNQSSYNALTMKLEQRFNNGLQLLTAFTWSKTIDEVSEIQTQGGNVKNVPQYAYRKDLERGLASYDQTRRFITSLLYELPFGKGKQWLNSGNADQYDSGRLAGELDPYPRRRTSVHDFLLLRRPGADRQ